MESALCNELFGSLSLEESCALTARNGFTGLEIAPFTLAEDPRTLGADDGREIRKTLESHGLRCAGFHWLLAAPKGLQIASPNPEIRETSWEVLDHLVRLCGVVGGQTMVLGSPAQRSAPDIPAAEARGRLIEGLRSLVPALEGAGVKFLVEALASENTKIVNTLAEAREVVDEVASPMVRGMFDFHNVGDETAVWADLIREHAAYIEHVHVNTLEGSYPTSLTPEYAEAFRALREIEYRGWVSLEIFHFDHPPEKVLSTFRGFLDEGAEPSP